MMDQDTNSVRTQITQDYPIFYSLKCSEIDNINVLKWYSNIQTRDDSDTYTSLAGEYFRMIVNSFFELVSCYAYSVAAEKVAQKHDEENQEGYANHWRFSVRNYHFHMFIPRYYSLLDYCAFLINELSGPEFLVKDNKSREPRSVNYEKVIKRLDELRENNKKRGVLTKADLLICYEALRGFKIRLSTQGEELINRFRDVITHRYLPGIDEMTIGIERSCSRTRVNSSYGKLMTVKQSLCAYDYYGFPEFHFKQLEPLAKVLVLSADQSLKKLSSIEIIKRAFSY